MTRRVLLLLLVSTVASAQPGAGSLVPAEPERKTPFDQGRFSLGLGLNYGGAADERYYVFGGGLGYYVLDGVEVGLGAALQFGAGPEVLRATPGLRYIAQPLVGRSPLIPYVGTFFSRYFVSDGLDDMNTVGGRLGAIYVGSVLVGLGLVVEHIVSECTTNCTDYYPEFTFALSF